MNQIALIAQLSARAASLSGPRFVGVTYRSKESGELARHTLILGASYANLLAESRAQLSALAPTLSGIDSQACTELLASVAESIAAHAAGRESAHYTQAGIWQTVCPGLRVDEQTGRVQIAALAHAKRVIEPGTFKPDTRRPLTKAKDAIRATLPMGKFRTLSVEADALESVRIAGSELELA